MFTLRDNRSSIGVFEYETRRRIMTIGERIKELRKKNDFTQEKLADYLCVSYQAVSKWECGLSNPDLALLVPLAKLLKVTTDELLGAVEKETDTQYEELEAVHEKTYETGDLALRLKTSERAVKEYPGDMKWMCRYAWDMWFWALQEKDDAVYEQWREKAIHSFYVVIENTDEEAVREHAITGIVHCLCAKGCKKEAKKYVDLLPEPKETEGLKENLLGMCLEGEEQLSYKQHSTEQLLQRLLSKLLWDNVAEKKYACEAAEGILKVMIPDGNYCNYHFEMSHIQFKKAEVLMHEQSETAVSDALDCLKEAVNHAKEYDLIASVQPGQYKFTAPLFKNVTMDSREWCRTGDETLLDEIKELSKRECFDCIRGSMGFKNIFES